jgi:hypothetical protein
MPRDSNGLTPKQSMVDDSCGFCVRCVEEQNPKQCHY